MIKRINFIKNFGVFKSYKRNGNIQDFDKVNILYGWNYSGKTTISRLFQCFELNKINSHYDGCEFEIEDFEGHKLNENNLQDVQIRTFNSDFIRDNIYLEGGNFNPILLLGEDTKQAQDNLKKEVKRLEKVRKIRKNLKIEADNLEKSNLGGLTKTASKIKETLQIVEAYHRTHFKPTFEEVKKNHKKYHLKSSEFNDLVKIATRSEENKLPEILNYLFNIDIEHSIIEVQPYLKKVPEFSSTIQHLIDNPEIANWVERGLKYHNENSKCEFCGNELETNRLNSLKAHFSKDLIQHKNTLELLIDKIARKKLPIANHKPEQFYPTLRSEFDNKYSNLLLAIQEYNKEYDKLIKLIEGKRNNPFQPILDFSSINQDYTKLAIALKEINDLITKNNNITFEFDTAKKKAKNRIKKYYASKYIDSHNVLEKERKIELYRKRADQFEEIEIDLNKSIAELEAKISQAHKGKEKINQFIEKFLGRNEIQVEVTIENNVELFRLKRKDSSAVNLSEGEKTAIAFSFFLTKLLECQDLSQTIVYIDDPISSLDSNHIFQVNALLKDFFFSKEDPEKEDSSIKINCQQLFISTHNFDFFGLLRELPKPKDGNKFYYYIRRVDSEKSTLEKLPKAIQNYSSEYHYLFELIYNFDNQDEKDFQVLMGIPNAVRRFMELYTYSRIPGNHDNSTVDKRAEKLWGAEKSKRILKVLHYFSHANNIERMMKNSDLMCDIEKAVSDLHKLIKEDAIHYAELVKTVNK